MEPFSRCEMEIFIPESHLNALQTALQQMGAGHIGSYDSCLSYSYVIGHWRPLKGNSPYPDSYDEVSREQELKVEVTYVRERVRETLTAVKKIYPYEEPAINVIPLYMIRMGGTS